MIPEYGQFALILATCLAFCQGVMPLLGSYTGRRDWMLLARPAAVGQFVFIAISFAVLAYVFLVDDFSVLLAANHSNTNLPGAYKFAAVWGNHEGSMLLWSMILAVWTLAVAAGSHGQPLEFSSRVLGVLGIISTGILLFTLITSNPFARVQPPPFDGNDLNPLLQDPAMVAHPPILYVGYVGMAVPFAFAVAALLSGKLDRNWARWTRPWTVGAWIFLTSGIGLGSWWAYYELGWGGWWVWDPVENASFMPWLMGTALLHSLAVTERRGIFKSWTVLLAIAAFSLSLLGTFLTRSGVLESVHAFASDPARGLFILGLLVAYSGGALLLYALRASRLEAEGGFRLVSREAFLLGNNILLVIATLLILLGTFYPIFHEAFGEGELSVGEPYFNLVFLVPMLPMSFLLGLGMHAAWQKMSGKALVNRFRWLAVAAVVIALLVPLIAFGSVSLMTVIGLSAGIWVVFSSLVEPIARARNPKAARLSRAQWGMFTAHLGAGLFIIGATVTSVFSLESETAARVNDQWELGNYEIELIQLHTVQGPNFDADEGVFELRSDGEFVATLRSQKRVYHVRTEPMTEAAIDTGMTRDILVTLGQPLGDGAWSVEVRYKPMISFVWIGCIVMALGGLLAATDRRYRRKEKAAAAKDNSAGIVKQGAG